MGDRRQALVEAAFACIAELGFEGLRLRPVATAAGIDHSTLHHYFPTKEALVAAVLDHVTQQFSGTVLADREPAEQLRGHLVGLGRLIRQHPELFIVLAELDLRGRRDAAVRQVIARDEAGWRAMLADIWRRGAARGAWAVPLTPTAAAELVVAVVKGVRLKPNEAGKVLDAFADTLTRSA
jgi:AcrR family transcriptional regulator